MLPRRLHLVEYGLPRSTIALPAYAPHPLQLRIVDPIRWAVLGTMGLCRRSRAVEPDIPSAGPRARRVEAVQEQKKLSRVGAVEVLIPLVKILGANYSPPPFSGPPFWRGAGHLSPCVRRSRDGVLGYYLGTPSLGEVVSLLPLTQSDPEPRLKSGGMPCAWVSASMPFCIRRRRGSRRA